MDEADMAQHREEARENKSKKRKTTSIELEGNVIVDVEDEKKADKPAAPTAETSGSKAEEKGEGATKPDSSVGDGGKSGGGEAPEPERVKPKTVKMRKCEVCGAQVKAQGIGAHMRRVHPELMNNPKSDTPKTPKSEASGEVGGEAEGKSEGPFDLEKLKQNPVFIAAAAGLVLLLGLIAVLLIVKPKEPVAATMEASPEVEQAPVVKPESGVAPEVQPVRVNMEEMEGKIVELPDNEGVLKRYQVVKDHNTGVYNYTPV